MSRKENALKKQRSSAVVTSPPPHAGGESTWDRLAEQLSERHAGVACFVGARTFELHFVRAEIAEGKSTRFALGRPRGTLYVRATLTC